MSSIRKPVIKGLSERIASDLAQGQITVERLVYAMPEIPFTWRGQFVDDVGKRFDADIEFYFVVNPRLIREEHNSEIQAIRDQISTAQRVYERIAAAANVGTTKTQISREDLPSVPLLMELYAQLDGAYNRRLVDVVNRQGDGTTAWNWVDENGRPVNLTVDLLQSNARLANLLHNAFNEWWNPTKPLSGETTSTAPAITSEPTRTTNAASFVGSPLPSTAPASNNPITTDAATSPPGSEASS